MTHMEKKIILESVLDPIRNTRSPEIFVDINKEPPEMKEEVRQFILDICDKFIKSLDIPKAKVVELFMIGSMLGYQYNETSDIDIEIRINLTRDEFAGKWLLVPKLCYIPNTQHPVNFFVLFADDPEYDLAKCENDYDILNNKWIKVSNKNSKEIPYAYVRGISEFLIDGITLQMERTRRDLNDIQKFISLDPEKVAISENEKDKAVSNKINELLVDKDAIDLAHRMLFRLNNDGFENRPISISIDYTYDDARYSMNNLIYKYLDEFKYYEKMNALIKEVDEAIKLAQKEIKKNIETPTPEADNKIETQKEITESIGFKDIDGKFYSY